MIVYCICYAASYLLAGSGHYYLSGAALLAAAAWLYYNDYRRTKNLVNLRGVFSASWVGGQGIACLRLSNLQRDWKPITWICFFLAFAGFWWVYEILRIRLGDETGRERPVGRGRRLAHGRRLANGSRAASRPIYVCVLALSFLSLAAFLFETVRLGFMPVFMLGVPHAYSEFHVTGVHYLTVSCVLVPSLTVLYFLQGGSRRQARNRLVLIMTGISLLIPILCVSRFQLVFAVVTAVFTYLAYTRKTSPGPAAAAVLALIPFYVILTVLRSHNIEYLNGIFEMKNEAMPIFISQPYIYIANNYENFDRLATALPAHSLGMRMLFPLWTLTGLKFFFPRLISYPIYVDKAELTTLTMFYDAFYDFGPVGVLALSCVLGAVAYRLTTRLGRFRNPIGYLLYAQMGVYFALSFFTTWFSNTTTWFYLIVTGVMAFYCSRAGE